MEKKNRVNKESKREKDAPQDDALVMLQQIQKQLGYLEKKMNILLKELPSQKRDERSFSSSSRFNSSSHRPQRSSRDRFSREGSPSRREGGFETFRDSRNGESRPRKKRAFGKKRASYQGS